MIDLSARTLVAGDLRAVFLPDLGMLGASLRYRDEELLGRVDDIEAFALAGRTCGIPLLYPWANRLGSLRYQVAGREVLLDPALSLLHFTGDGLPMHGVPWSRLSWQVTGEDTNLDDRNFDDGFVVLEEFPSFSVTGGGRRITIEFLEGYRYAQVYGPSGKDYLALEPMTAPTNALATGRGLRLVEPGGMFRAAFRVGVELLL